MDRSFEVFNTDRMKNGEVMQFVPLEVKINRYKKQIDTAVMDLNSIDMFLGYDWLVKHNPEVDWNKETMWFTRCPKTCVKIVDSGLYFYSLFSLYFIFSFLFLLFLFLEQLRLGLIGHAVTSVTN